MFLFCLYFYCFWICICTFSGPTYIWFFRFVTATDIDIIILTGAQKLCRFIFLFFEYLVLSFHLSNPSQDHMGNNGTQ